MVIEVDPEGLSRSGRALERVAARLSQTMATFQAELSAFGPVWGSDDIGSLIGAAHDEVSAFAFECFDSALQEVAAAGVDLAGMANQYTEIEMAVTRDFDAIHKSLRG